jgi:hypothetical protein
VTAFEQLTAVAGLVAFDFNGFVLGELRGGRALILGEPHRGVAVFAGPELHDRISRYVLVYFGDCTCHADAASADLGLYCNYVGVVVLVELLRSGSIYRAERRL